MKKILFLLVVSILSFSLIGCKKSVTPEHVNINISSTFRGSLEIAETMNVNATVNPANADQTIIWSSSNELVATVDQSGLITAISVGGFILRATSSKEEIYAEASLEVISKSPTALEIIGDENIILGEVIQYSVNATPSDALALAVWTVDNEDLAEFDGTGKLISYAVGEVTITATSVRNENVKTTMVVNIALPEPELINITGPMQISILDQVTFTAVVYPILANQTIEWKVNDEDIATIDQEGKLTVVSTGQVIITATSTINAEVLDTLQLNISLPDATSVVVSGDTSVEATNTLQLSASVLPVEAEQTISWTSNDSAIASVDQNGLVTTYKAGIVTITAASKKAGVVGKKVITVIAPNPESLIIVGEANVTRGYNYSCKAIVTPEQAVQNVIWTSSDLETLTIDSNGALTLLSPGVVTITAVSTILETVTGTFEVAVTVVDPSVVEIDDVIIIPIFNEVPLNYTVYPYGAKNEFTWSSSNNAVATINENGVVTPVDAGDVTFTLTDNNNPLNIYNLETQICLPDLIVNQSLTDYTEGQEVIFKGKTYIYGTSAFNNLPTALTKATDEISIYLCDGTYSEAITISTNLCMIYCSNSGINPNKNMVNRSSGAVFTNKVTIAAELNVIFLNGLDFTGAGQVVSGGTNVSELYMAFCNFYDSSVPVGDDGLVYFKELGNTALSDPNVQLHHDFSFLYNRLVTPTSARLINIGAIENIEAIGNYFEGNNLSYADGIRANYLLGNYTVIKGNTFVKISQYAIFVYKENSASRIDVLDNLFIDAINVGSVDIRNSTNPAGIINILYNTFESISGTAIRIDHLLETSLVISANYNIFKGVGSKYLNNAKDVNHIDFTKNCFLDEFGNSIVIDITKIVGADSYEPYYSDTNGVGKYIPEYVVWS